MVEKQTTPPLAPHLHGINAELAQVLRCDPAELEIGSDAAMADDLVVCGILGGKDVGKSTLINALAMTTVSVDAAEVSRGTHRPMVYVHESNREAVDRRLGGVDGTTVLDVTTHNAEPIRNVVLVDLPDFDSEFADHLDIVRSVAPVLDRILWVLTPRKLGDRAWVEMLRKVIKDPLSIHCVLNKVDELLADDGVFGAPVDGSNPTNGEQAGAFWQRQHDWVASTLEASGCAAATDHRFLVSAAFPDDERFVRRIGVLWDDPDWQRYGDDRRAVSEVAHLATDELERLRSCVLAPVTEQQASAIKTGNRAEEQRVNAARIRSHFDLDRTLARLHDACEAACRQDALSEALGAEWMEAATELVESRFTSETDLADELLERRVEPWPLLRLMHWPLGWLSRALGRRMGAVSRALAARRAAPDAPHTYSQAATVDSLTTGGVSLSAKIDLFRSRILADHAVVAESMGLARELPEASALARSVASNLESVAPTLEARLLDEIRGSDRRPGLLGRLALWLILLWFPILQPVSAGLLEVFSSDGTFQLTHGLYLIVTALSATHLLAGLAIVGVIYVALLAGMYVRALRVIRSARSRTGTTSAVADAVDEILITEVCAPMAKPFYDRHERIAELAGRLETTSGTKRTD